MSSVSGVREHPLSPYASHAMLHLWSDRWKIRQERNLWLAVAAEQANLGVFDEVKDFDNKLDAYRKAADIIYTWRIQERELRTKHDVKARLEEFNDVASGLYGSGETLELMHWGMTSADSVDNLSLMQLRIGLIDLANRSPRDSKMKLLQAAESVPFRGLKGPVGTQQDMLDLLGSAERVALMERRVAERLGFKTILNSVGQVYPRSLDTMVATALMAWACKGNPWAVIGRGYLNMIISYSGDQWNEGDVSTSAIRRVALPGIFLASDAAVRRVKP